MQSKIINWSQTKELVVAEVRWSQNIQTSTNPEMYVSQNIGNLTCKVYEGRRKLRNSYLNDNTVHIDFRLIYEIALLEYTPLRGTILPLVQ